jgi:hypothetical protein
VPELIHSGDGAGYGLDVQALAAGKAGEHAEQNARLFLPVNWVVVVARLQK